MNKEELNRDIGSHLVTLRRAKKITAKSIAEQLGISAATYRYVEAGKTELTFSRIWQLAEILGVEMYEVIGYDANDLCSRKTQELREQMQSYQDKIITLQDNNHTLNQKILLQERKKKLKP